MTHGRNDEAERTVDEIEERVKNEGVELKPVDESKALEITETPRLGFVELIEDLLRQVPETVDLRLHDDGDPGLPLQRDLLQLCAGAVASSTRSPSGSIPYYFFPFAIGNLLGPLLLGHLFDVVGRRKMILLTYGRSGILLLVSAWMFDAGMLLGRRRRRSSGA